MIIIDGTGWHPGVIGIVSSRILSKYGKPNIIITTEESDPALSRGSIRSVSGFSVHDMLTACSPLLLKYGGHEKAGGLSIATADIGKLRAAVARYAAENFPAMPRDTVIIDKILEPGDLTLENTESLSLLEPFGEGNPPPLFIMRNCRLISKKPLKDGKYVSFTVVFSGQTLKVLDFNTAYADFCYKENDTLDIAVSLSVNEFAGRSEVSIRLKSAR